MKYSDVKKILLQNPAIRYFYMQKVSYDNETSITFTNYFTYEM